MLGQPRSSLKEGVNQPCGALGTLRCWGFWQECCGPEGLSCPCGSGLAVSLLNSFTSDCIRGFFTAGGQPVPAAFWFAPMQNNCPAAF